MNNTRRKSILVLLNKMAGLKEEAEAIRDEEQEAFDNLPESMQNGDKGSTMQEAIDKLTEAVEGLDTAQTSLEDIS